MRRALVSSSCLLANTSAVSSGNGCSSPPSIPTSTSINRTPVRHMNYPGWKTSLSTGDGRSKEQREIDRKQRHLDKLPKAVALHAPQYPYDRHVLADHMMQPIVFSNELDTPSLYMAEGPSDMFVYWNCNDFNRPQYPRIPDEDHRLLFPDRKEYEFYAHLGQQYLRKHKIVPTYFSTTPQSVNMSVVFSGTYDVRARTDESGALIPPPPPVKTLHSRNFWFTAHYGNYIDLHELQQAPSVFLNTPKEDAKEKAYYTLVMATPDYPYRTDPNATFMLNYVVANIPASGSATAPRKGVVVVPYCPPLPTEDAGSVRQLCILYKQKGGKISNPALRAMEADEEKTLLPFAARSAFRFHDDESEEGRALRERFGALAALEEALPHTPSTINFFHTKWDIQVQEYYERIGEPEPAYCQGEEMEATLSYLAKPRSAFTVRSRYLADGTINQGDTSKNFMQWTDTRIGENTATSGRSARHRLGHNGKEKVIFNGPGKYL